MAAYFAKKLLPFFLIFHRLINQNQEVISEKKAIFALSLTDAADILRIGGRGQQQRFPTFPLPWQKLSTKPASPALRVKNKRGVYCY